MPDFILSNRAKMDVKDIGRYTLETWGKDQRNRYLSMLYAEFDNLAENPIKGRNCGNILVGYRRQNIGKHVVFYHADSAGVVEIVRVLHERMDVSTRLLERN